MLLFSFFFLTKNDFNVKTDKLEGKKNEEKNEIRCIQSYREPKTKTQKKKNISLLLLKSIWEDYFQKVKSEGYLFIIFQKELKT